MRVGRSAIKAENATLAGDALELFDQARVPAIAMREIHRGDKVEFLPALVVRRQFRKARRVSHDAAASILDFWAGRRKAQGNGRTGV
jgi:hypothetical protein